MCFRLEFILQAGNGSWAVKMLSTMRLESKRKLNDYPENLLEHVKILQINIETLR